MHEIKAIPQIPKRLPDSHKGDFGRVLIIAGSRGMAGAAALAGASALRSGAGLVTIACPSEVQPTVAQYEPSYMTWPLPNDKRGRIDFPNAQADLEPLIERADVVAVGPGLGQSAAINDLVAWIVQAVDVPLVIDADALNALVGRATLLKDRKSPFVLTPHPGELARLFGYDDVAEIQRDRLATAISCAKSFGDACTLVLKGHQSIITDGDAYHVNSSGNPGMATGGSGDCLTGVIAALLGQRLKPLDAAILGVYAHGLAGDVARDQNGEIGMIAGDIVDSLADAFFHLGQPD